jgi:hypothetical protein
MYMTNCILMIETAHPTLGIAQSYANHDPELDIDTFDDITFHKDEAPLKHAQVIRSVIAEGVLADSVGPISSASRASSRRFRDLRARWRPGSDRCQDESDQAGISRECVKFG